MALTKIESAGLAKPVDLAEVEKIRFGDNADLQIWHQGNSNIGGSSGVMYLYNTGANATDLDVRAQNDILLKPQNGANGIRIIGEGAVELYHNGTKKVQTTDTGVKIESGLLEIAHTSCHLDFMETSTTNHRLRNGSGNFHIQRISDDKNTTTTQFLVDGGTGAVELYHNGTKKCETAADGLKMASGQGISFHNYNSGTNIESNLLDDYEEGNWVPEWGVYGGAEEDGTFTYYVDNNNITGQHGNYVKVGKQVTCWFYINYHRISTVPDGTYVRLKNLPFTVTDLNANHYGATEGATMVINWKHLSGAGEGGGGTITGFAHRNRTHILLGNKTQTAVTAFTPAECFGTSTITSGTNQYYMYGQISYTTA